MQIKGLLIKETKFNEQDKIVTLLTTQGQIQAVVHGARSARSKNLAAMQPFCYSEVTLAKGRGALRSVKESSVINNFYNLRLDVEKVALAAYIAEVLQHSAEGEDTESILRLALNTLYILEKSDDVAKIKAVFELRLCVHLGFTPVLWDCVHCGQEGDFLYFSCDGGIVCEECPGGEPISKNTLEVMRYIVSSDENKIFSFRADVGEFCRVAEKYLIYNIGRKPSSLDYFKKCKEF